MAESEIIWEEVAIGERLGLDSFGEVFRGEWHGLEVTIKRFLQQDISSDAFEAFRSEVYEFPHFKYLKAIQNGIMKWFIF
jgi:hypothetical protein